MKTLTIAVSETVYDLLQVLAGNDQNVESVIELLIDHAQQGVYRPGSWERAWLRDVFPEDEWLPKLEPGDPYGRPDCEKIFQRPRREP
jgi:hypothetical protein